MERRGGSQAVELCCAILLAVAAMRLFQLDRDLYDQNRAGESRVSRILTRGSLKNVVPAHWEDSATEANRLLLLFVFHVNRAANEVALWNAVHKEVGMRRLDVEVVGVCDQVDVCSVQRETSAFRLIEVLDPHQARILATADDNGTVLLYRGGTLAAQLQRMEEATAIVTALADALKP